MLLVVKPKEHISYPNIVLLLSQNDTRGQSFKTTARSSNLAIGLGKDHSSAQYCFKLIRSSAPQVSSEPTVAAMLSQWGDQFEDFDAIIQGVTFQPFSPKLFYFEISFDESVTMALKYKSFFEFKQRKLIRNKII